MRRREIRIRVAILTHVDGARVLLHVELRVARVHGDRAGVVLHPYVQVGCAVDVDVAKVVDVPEETRADVARHERVLARPRHANRHVRLLAG